MIYLLKLILFIIAMIDVFMWVIKKEKSKRVFLNIAADMLIILIYVLN